MVTFWLKCQGRLQFWIKGYILYGSFLVINPLLLQMYEKAEKLVTQSFSNDSHIMRPDGSTRVYMQLASLLLTHTERYHEAYRLTTKAIRVEEDWEQTHKLMGKCLVKLERYSEAAVAFKKAVSYEAYPL